MSIDVASGLEGNLWPFLFGWARTHQNFQHAHHYFLQTSRAVSHAGKKGTADAEALVLLPADGVG
jgi:hypothetical protein